jgi:hypothetical protein
MSEEAVYVFDIGNNLIHKFKNKSFFNNSRFKKKMFVGYDRIRYSTQTNQQCLLATFFVTYDENFLVSYSPCNHNAIAIRGLHGRRFFDSDFSIEYQDSAFEIKLGKLYYNYNYRTYVRENLGIILSEGKKYDTNFNVAKRLDFDTLNEFFLRRNQF